MGRLTSFFKKLRLLTSNQKQLTTYYRKSGMTIGEDCQFPSNTDFGSEPYLISLGNNVKMSSGCQFVTHDGGVNVLRNLDADLNDVDVFDKIIVGNNVFIGIDSLIMPGVQIGDNVVVGARSVVTKDIPSNSVACGVPAKVIKSIEDYKQGCLKKCDMTKYMSASEKKEYLLNKQWKND